MKRIVRRNVIHTSLLCLALLLGACSPAGNGTESQITITGSTSVTPFIEQLAERYQQLHPDRQINVQGLGSSAGIQAAENGTAALGMSSRHLEADEEQILQVTEIARDALVMIVHPTIRASNLTPEQVQGIFTGQIKNWSDVGGPNSPITIVTREAGSGTYSAFEELVMDNISPAMNALRQGSNGAVRQIVAEDPDAIGYISLGIVDESVKTVAIDGVVASSDAVRSGTYTLVRPFLFVQRKDTTLPAIAQDFVNFTLSPEGQEELVQGGLIQGADAQ